ncbi:MAG TPA: hypothetical protein VG206_15850 [Terriglobia bacterium]|nr:hypothetical protein [Terriglobia bacterium]
MSGLRRVLEDVKNGENIDLYVTLLVAVILVTMNVLGFVATERLLPLNLAILALITLSLLVNRHRLNDVVGTISALKDRAVFLEEFPADFSVQLDEAREVWLTGTHHSAVLTSHYQLFETKVNRGDRLRFLLLDPKGTAYKMAAMRFPGLVGAEQERMRIESSLATLLALQALAPDRVEIRVIDFPLDYTAYLLDPTSGRGAIYLERYTFKVSGGSRKPKFVYKKRDGRWFEHLLAEVGHLWETAKPWTPSAHLGTGRGG